MDKITTTDLKNFDCLFISSEWKVYEPNQGYETEFRNKVVIVEPTNFKNLKNGFYNGYVYKYKSTETPIVLDKKWIKLNWIEIKENHVVKYQNHSLSHISEELTHSILFDLTKKSFKEYCVRVVVYMYNSRDGNQKIGVFTRKDNLKSLKSAPMKSTRKQQKDGKKMYGQYKRMVGDVKQMGKQFSKNFKQLI